MNRILKLTMALVASICLLAACAKAPDDGDAAFPQGTGAVEPDTTASVVSAQRKGNALSIRREVYECDKGVILYPFVYGGSDESEAINEAVLHDILTAAADIPHRIFTEYRIQYNKDGIYSILVYLQEIRGSANIAVVPLNFDAKTGKKYVIADCFSRTDDGWRAALAGKVTQGAEDRGLTLISDVAPVGDDRGFYVSTKGLTMVYRPYEIVVNKGRTWEFTVPISELGIFLSSDSLLSRMEGAGG